MSTPILEMEMHQIVEVFMRRRKRQAAWKLTPTASANMILRRQRRRRRWRDPFHSSSLQNFPQIKSARVSQFLEPGQKGRAKQRRPPSAKQGDFDAMKMKMKGKRLFTHARSPWPGERSCQEISHSPVMSR